MKKVYKSYLIFRHCVSVGFIKRTLLRNLGQLHIHLLRQDRDRVASQTGDDHGSEVGDVLPFPEGRDSSSDPISGLDNDHLHAERP